MKRVFSDSGVADIGSGAGYFAVRFADAVPVLGRLGGGGRWNPRAK